MGAKISSSNSSSNSFPVDQNKEIIVRKETTEITNEEKQLIKSQWHMIDEKSNIVCVDIFCRIFELKPEAKGFFPFKDIDGEALVQHPYFKGHVTRFLNAVRMAVLNLDSWEVVLIPNLIQLGHKHAHIKGFKHEYFEVFFTAMDQTWSEHLGISYTAQAKHAWAKIFRIIVSSVEDGYVERLNIDSTQEDNKAGLNTPTELLKPNQSEHCTDIIDGMAHAQIKFD